MFYDNSGMTRAICDVLRMTGIILFGAWNEKYKQPKFLENAAQEDLYQKLLRMVDEGKLNEAEDELLECIDRHRVMEVPVSDAEQQRRQDLEMALSVYGYMNDKEDAFLEEHGFSREEILDGIRSMQCEFGLQSIGQVMNIVEN